VVAGERLRGGDVDRRVADERAVSADRRQSYCLYEAPSPDELIAAAQRASIPADVIVEVNRVSADMVS
jgi:hypothetical protein